MTKTLCDPWTVLPRQEGQLLALTFTPGLKTLELKGVHHPGNFGWVIGPYSGEDNPPEKWIPRGLVENEKIHYFTGPFLEGESLYLLLEENRVTPAHLSLLARGLPALASHIAKENSRLNHFTRISALGTFFSRDGRLLVLSDEIIHKLLPLAQGGKNPWEERLNFRGKTDEQNLVFGWSVLAYLVFSGTVPFADEEEELRHRIQKGVFSPLERYAPQIQPELSRLIRGGLLPAGGETPGPEELARFWEKKTSLSKDDFLIPLSPREAQIIQEAAEKTALRRESRFGWKGFFRKKGTLVGVIAAGIILLGTVLFPILSGALAPPLTRGMEPRQVLEAFFDGINSLDVTVTQGCVYKKAAKDRINTILNLYAVSRVRMGYEGRSPFVSAPDWLARPDRSLEEGEMLFGITGLEIRPLSKDSFHVTYREWNSFFEGTEGEQNLQPALMIQGMEIEEEYRLIWKREAWLISDIIPVSRKEIRP